MRWRGLIAGVMVWLLAGGVAHAQPGDPDAGVADAAPPDDGGTPPDDGGVAAGPDARPRIVIDGPTMLGIARPQVSATAAPTELRLGDKLTLFVEVIYDETVTVALSAGLDLAPIFDELRRSTVDELRSDGTKRRVYQVQLQVWELGDLRIPPVQVSYSIGGQSSWVVTNEVPVRVLGSIDSIDDPNAFLGAAPPVELRRRDWRWIIAGGAVLALAIGVLAAWIVSRRRARARLRAREVGDFAPFDRDLGGDAPTVPAAIASTPPERAAAPKAPPRVFVLTHDQRRALGDAARRALDAIDALERAGTLRTDQPEGYRALVAIVRTFAEEQFRLPPRPRTSGELLRALGRTSIRPGALATTTTWLAACDLVKFAAARAEDDGVGALAGARAVVIEAAGGEVPGADEPAAPVAPAEAAS